jgi:nucleotide-binding universal stress UspA family protein
MVMADVILAVLGRRETAHSVLDAARCLAGLARAGVIVLAVDTPPPGNPLAAEALMAEVGDVEGVLKRDRRRIASLKFAFDAWSNGAREAGITVQWAEVEGSASVVVEERGRRADYIVIAQPAPDDDAPTRHEFQAALFHTERPVLVVPKGKSTPFGRNVAIAWRDDSRTAKALIPALRVLGSAEQVHLLAGVRKGATAPGIPVVLQDHGIAARLHILPIGQDPFGKLLLGTLHELGADMLVMGAYAHTPLREMMFGGVTRYMCDHADVPVLMRH